MKSKRKLLLVAALSCALFSCSDKLEREEAAELIIKHYDFPYVDIERISSAGVEVAHLSPNRAFNLFGGIQIGKSSDLLMFSWKVFSLTDKGAQYLVPNIACDKCREPLPDFIRKGFYCVATNIWEFKEVSGITVGATGETADVEYVVVATEVNTFGEYKERSEGMEEKRTAVFKHFDDGSWRIMDKKPPHIVKPSDVSYYAEHYTKK